MSAGGGAVSDVCGDAGGEIRVHSLPPRPPRHPRVRLGEGVPPRGVHHRAGDVPGCSP